MKHALTPGTKDFTARQRRNFGDQAYTPRVREEHEALPPQINKMAGTYTPPTWHTRANSMDHQSIKSRGF